MNLQVLMNPIETGASPYRQRKPGSLKIRKT